MKIRMKIVATIESEVGLSKPNKQLVLAKERSLFISKMVGIFSQSPNKR